MWKRRNERRRVAAVVDAPVDLLPRAEEAHRRGDYEAAAAGYEQVLGLEASPLDPVTRVRVLRQVTEVHSVLGRSHEADAVSTEAVHLARPLGGSPLAEALWNAGYVALHRNDLETARRFLEEAVELARLHEEPTHHPNLGPALLNLARVNFTLEKWDEGRELIQELMTLNTTREALFGGAIHAQWIAREAGDFDKAMDWAESTWTAMIQSGVVQPDRLIGALSWRSDAALDLGDMERARIAVSQALKLADRAFRTAAHAAAGDVALEEEDWKTAEFHYEEALARAVKTDKPNALLFLADTMLSIGNHGRAEELVEAAKAEAREMTDDFIADLLELDGGIQHGYGELDRARAAYRHVWERYRQMGHYASAAEIALKLGTVEADAGRMDSAARYLSEATPLSARPSNQRQRAELAHRVA